MSMQLIPSTIPRIYSESGVYMGISIFLDNGLVDVHMCFNNHKNLTNPNETKYQITI